MQMAVSVLDPVETLPYLHQSRHPHPSVPMESQQYRPCQWTIRVPTQPESRSLQGCLTVSVRSRDDCDDDDDDDDDDFGSM